MGIELTKKHVQAISKLDFSGLPHTRRLDLIAKALGIESQTALMGIISKGARSIDPVRTIPPIPLHVNDAARERLGVILSRPGICVVRSDSACDVLGPVLFHAERAGFSVKVAFAADVMTSHRQMLSMLIEAKRGRVLLASQSSEFDLYCDMHHRGANLEELSIMVRGAITYGGADLDAVGRHAEGKAFDSKGYFRIYGSPEAFRKKLDDCVRREHEYRPVLGNPIFEETQERLRMSFGDTMTDLDGKELIRRIKRERFVISRLTAEERQEIYDKSQDQSASMREPPRPGG